MRFAKIRKRDLLVSAIAMVLVTAVFLPVRASAHETSYQEAPSVARMSETLGGTFVLGKDDIEWSHAEPNLIVEKGDLLQTDETGMAEIQFDRRDIVRIGERSRIAFVELGEPNVIGMDSGKLYLRITRKDIPRSEFMVTFLGGQISTAEMALVRLDVFEDGRAEVAVIRGSIDLITTSGTTTVLESGDRVVITSQGMTEYLPYEFVQRDDFGAWSEERDLALSMYRRPDYLQEDIIGAEDLEDYGEWIYSNDYDAYAWRPYVVEDWQPYYYGRWYDSPYYGYTWIPVEPWGYVTYHYGSWNYDPYYGWIWLPGYTWRPAHVHWVACGDYFGWVPIGYYGYPVITTYPYYVRTISISYVYYDSFAFAHRSHFHDGHKHHHRFSRHRHRDGDRDGHRDRDRDRHRGDDRVFNPGDRFERGRIEITGKHHWDLENIRKGTLRNIENIKNEKLAGTLRKGKAERRYENWTGEKILDVTKSPKLRSKIEKLTARRSWADNRRETVKSDMLPKKLERDRVKAFDFRKRIRADSPDDGRSEERIRKHQIERRSFRKETPIERNTKDAEPTYRYEMPEDRSRRDKFEGSTKTEPMRQNRIEVIRPQKKDVEIKRRFSSPDRWQSTARPIKSPNSHDDGVGEQISRRPVDTRNLKTSRVNRNESARQEPAGRAGRDWRRVERMPRKMLMDKSARAGDNRGNPPKTMGGRVARVEQMPIRQGQKVEFEAESQFRRAPEGGFSGWNDRSFDRGRSEGRRFDRSSQKFSPGAFRNRR